MNRYEVKVEFSAHEQMVGKIIEAFGMYIKLLGEVGATMILPTVTILEMEEQT